MKPANRKKYIRKKELANLVYRLGDQAQHAYTNRELTQETYRGFLSVISRVHDSYLIDMDKIQARDREMRATDKKYALALIGAFSIALLIAYILIEVTT
jgi:hypothetical protein